MKDNAELASLALELGGGMERLLGLSAENWASNVLRRFAVQEDGGEDMWMEALELCGHFGFRDGAEAILRARSKRWPEEARRHAVDTAAFLAVDGYPTKNVFVKIFRRKKRTVTTPVFGS